MSRRSFFSLAAAGAAVAGSGAIALDQYRDNTRTKEQQEQIKRSTGRDILADEIVLDELEERVAPIIRIFAV